MCRGFCFTKMKIKIFRRLDRPTRKAIFTQYGNRCCRCQRPHELVFIEICKINQEDDFTILCDECIEEITREAKEEQRQKIAYKQSLFMRSMVQIPCGAFSSYPALFAHKKKVLKSFLHSSHTTIPLAP